MRSTAPGIYERELDAVGKFLFYRDGRPVGRLLLAGGDGNERLVSALSPGGEPARRRRVDPDGLRARRRLLHERRDPHVAGERGPGASGSAISTASISPATRRSSTPSGPGMSPTVMGDAATRMEEIVRDWPFTKHHYRPAAEAFVAAYRRRAAGRPNGVGHGVGMAVHDVGNADGTLTPGMVFTIEPQFRVPEGPDLHPPGGRHRRHRRRRRKHLGVRSDGDGRHRGADGGTPGCWTATRVPSTPSRTPADRGESVYPYCISFHPME